MPQVVASPIRDVCERVCAEFLEMPGLRLTLAQAQRLWDLDQRTCLEVLDVLIEQGFIQRTVDGRFRRAMDGPLSGQLREWLRSVQRQAVQPLSRTA